MKPVAAKPLPAGLLLARFQHYFAEMESCMHVGAYWALLHIIVSIPDICVSLESARGNSRTKLYINWCDRFLRNSWLSGAERHRIRCMVLHRGNNIRPSESYLGFNFRQPCPDKQAVASDKGNLIPSLDVSELAEEMESGVKFWIGDLEKLPLGPRATNTYRNIFSLVHVGAVKDSATADSFVSPADSIKQ